MPQEVHGNITGIRESQLQELAAIYDCPFDTDEFIQQLKLLMSAAYDGQED